MQQSSVAQAEWIVFSSMNQRQHEMSNALASLGSSGSMTHGIMFLLQQPNSPTATSKKHHQML